MVSKKEQVEQDCYQLLGKLQINLPFDPTILLLGMDVKMYIDMKKNHIVLVSFQEYFKYS